MTGGTQLTEDPSERGLRADARRNRRKVIDAARARFARHGPGAQIDDIARDARVGVGTVYRHFPTEEALLEALAADQVRRLTAWAHEALAAGDAGEAFCAYLRRVGELHAADRMLSDVVARPGRLSPAGPRPRRAQHGHQRAAPPGPGSGRGTARR